MLSHLQHRHKIGMCMYQCSQLTSRKSIATPAHVSRKISCSTQILCAQTGRKLGSVNCALPAATSHFHTQRCQNMDERHYKMMKRKKRTRLPLTKFVPLSSMTDSQEIGTDTRTLGVLSVSKRKCRGKGLAIPTASMCPSTVPPTESYFDCCG